MLAQAQHAVGLCSQTALHYSSQSEHSYLAHMSTARPRRVECLPGERPGDPARVRNTMGTNAYSRKLVERKLHLGG